MTPKERLLIAMRHGIPDHVPVSPDISVMVPDRLTGKPFHDIHLDGIDHFGWTSASHAEAYVDAVNYFGMDGFYMYGGIREIRKEDAPSWKEEIIDVPQGKLVKRMCQTKKGALTEEEIFFADEPPWRDKKPIKDLKADFKKYKLIMGTGPWKYEKHFKDYDRIGDNGVYLGMTPVFQDWWFHNRHGGFEKCFMDFTYETEFMDKVHAFWLEWALENIKAMVTAKPDVIMLGGSSASLSVSSPKFFRKYELPFIQKASDICKNGNIISHFHVCGRSLELVEIVAEESNLQSMEPVEEPPGGNVNLADIKKRFGHKLCIKGNLNTTEFMLRATPEEVEEKCKRVIDAAADSGGFILSTGDQCGRDTPDANLFKMVEVAKTYGKY